VQPTDGLPNAACIQINRSLHYTRILVQLKPASCCNIANGNSRPKPAGWR